MKGSPRGRDNDAKRGDAPRGRDNDARGTSRSRVRNENPPRPYSRREDARREETPRGRGNDAKREETPRGRGNDARGEGSFPSRGSRSGYSEPREKGPAGKDTRARSFTRNIASDKRSTAGRNTPRGSGPAVRRTEREHPFKKFKHDKPVSSIRKSEDVRDKKIFRGKAGTSGHDKKFSEPKEIRLNRYLANSGVSSRREADNYITAGYVTVNDKVVKELGSKVKYSDVVRFKGKKLNPEKKIYLLLNKPKDYITTVDDPYAKQTVMELVRNSCRERIYPVGRLDRHTTGLLLFTNDGELTKMLTHPSHKVAKIYQVGLDRPVELADLEKIAGGFELEDGPVIVDEISYLDEGDKSQVGIQLHSGKNRIVRRIFKHLDYKVIKLDRVFFAGLTKKNIPRGKYRFLNEKEINMLKMNIFR